ncbi:hypothetical protein jhhlp_000147 [Lomentospora prolificans]|uniref:Carbohydrate esterase 2 N-terminal domain-containing protein n=1 Tax=Lomentospora prolificans TaxID=41688 RepID=A0A2N3NLP1_9PEZI|nr:hypothetical protein jhhlp_000147 [Lomentospora prolificans]
MKPYLNILALAGLVAAQAEVRFLGRVNPETKELSWPGTGVSFTFTGTQATISVASTKGTSSVELTVDGESTVIENVDGDISTPAGLSEGTHSVVLHKRSGSDFGSIFIGEVDTDGSFVAEEPRARQIEVIGDSISVGYGLDGTNPCTNTAAVENNPKTYGVLAAEALDADYSIVAWSGRGLTRNYADPSLDNTPLMPELYTRYGANDPADSYTFPEEWNPDVVVINLGTNDWSYLGARDPIDPAVFTEAMVEFVQTVQGHYPDATYFLLSSPMLNDDYPSAEDAQHSTHAKALQNAISEIGGDNIHFLDWPAQGADVGCDYHPNAATNAAQADVLAAAIAAELGW